MQAPAGAHHHGRGLWIATSSKTAGMGTWSDDTFGNDKACDWLGDFLEKPDPARIGAIIDEVNESEPRDVDCAEECLAACEIIARARGCWGLRDAYSEKLDTWIEEKTFTPDPRLIASALTAIDHISSEESPLRQAWADVDGPMNGSRKSAICVCAWAASTRPDQDAVGMPLPAGLAQHDHIRHHHPGPHPIPTRADPPMLAFPRPPFPNRTPMPDPFKAYDIRGLYPQELNEDLAYAIGNATAQVLGLAGKRHVVGRDMRVSGPMLKVALIKGMVDAGVIVIDVGMLSTPAVTHAMHLLDTAGGSMVTASHNPSPYGGVKITGPGFKPIGAGTGMEEIETLARAKKFVKNPGGRIEEAVTIDAYAAFLAKLWKPARPLKVVIDGGNGIIGTLFQHLAPRLPGLTIIPMYFDPDGRFPNHDANPLKTENLNDLRKRVVAEKADFGAGFDGDGDRCALVDEKGDIVACDHATAVLAKHFLTTEGPSAVVYDLRSSKAVPEAIKRLGGTPVETRVGHSFIKRTMKEHHACFAGELSGHYYFRDFYGADSGLYAFVLFANLISEAPNLSSLVAPMLTYFHTGEINFKVADGPGVMAKLKALPGGEVSELDGVTVRFKDWWCNLRASNTEPVVRLNLEGDSAALRDEKLAMVKKIITG